MRVEFDGYVISSDKSLLQLERIYSWLGQSYWASHRPAETIKRSIESEASICFGVYGGGNQIGFARAVTDQATMYWLCDVWIDEAYRGRGVGKRFVDSIIQSDELIHLSGFLGTADAHRLYEQHGFVKDSERFMVRRPKHYKSP
ncbi:GNAT family N-acetyltransferase [Paenibacillus soyae]|uniref:GNAT family N-acetyltransferase n=1 Tax=Paenibacillus soyae TaxID=2969249 RepID=A0A9X2MRS4_9BACL|nr:GNAT family N-acetyltransferase [Paenibacillus soyae]MCR2802782.1 GNAT family N-acetyltransferase [Paenibacillus soyae]